jgi:hypothetical protein
MKEGICKAVYTEEDWKRGVVAVVVQVNREGVNITCFKCPR